MKDPLLYIRTSIGILCSLIFLLEILVPTEYVFGHLYIAPLLLASFQLSRTDISKVTIIGILLTSLDFIIPNSSYFSTLNFGSLPIDTLANRLNVIIVLLLTNWLIQRNLKYAEKIDVQNEEITYHKAELIAQLSLAKMREDFVHTLTHDLKAPLLGGIETIKSFQ
jgi:two-component system, NarL family, sensor kinase